MSDEGPAPLIVTLEADPASQDRFDRARERWFPTERNFIPAHVTLFHKLSGDRVAEVAMRLRSVAEAMPAPPASPPSCRSARVRPTD